MKHWKAVGLFACLTASLLPAAETTPLTQDLQEQNEITIACKVTQQPNLSDVPVVEAGKFSEDSKATYHYRLWLPKGYLADKQRRWPCMFIASVGGDAQMENMAGWLKENNYIVVLLVESKNGAWGTCIANFIAAHDDVVKRVRIQEGLKMATGVSGSARASSVFVQTRPGFSGLILQAAGAGYTDNGTYLVAGLKRNESLYVAMTMGTDDSNKSEVPRMKSGLNASHLLVLEFNGGHGWAPAETFVQAMTWIERQVYEDGPTVPALRPVYVQRVKTQLADMDSATSPWEKYKKGEAVLAFSRKRNLTMDSALSIPLGKLQAVLAKLKADPAVSKELAAANALRGAESMRERTPPSMFAANCRNIAKQYPGTEAAAQAEALANAAK